MYSWNATDFVAPQWARVGARDELIEASGAITVFNARAGGSAGNPIALPALGRVARLARALQTPVTRTIVVGDDHVDLELHVRAVPDGAVVDLRIGAVHARPPRSSWLSVQPADAPPVTEKMPPWTWATDAALVITALDLSPDDSSQLLPADVVGLPLTRLVRLVEDDTGDLPIVTALARASDLHAQRAVRRDEPLVEWQLSAKATHDEAGRFVGFAGTARQIPPRAISVPAILDAKTTRRLQGALRGPLDRIVGRAETIAAQSDGPLRRDYADYAGDIARAGRHLLALVDDLADLEAIEDRAFTVAREGVDLADLGRRGAGLLAVRAATAGVRIDAPSADEVSPACGDFTRALQVVVNVIGNAVRYSPAGSVIWVRIERDGDTAVLIVADQGKGIAAADHERIFDKFERVDPGEAEGSGLGLYISRRLARAMGGDIVVDSAPGQGARFVFTLPAA